MCNSTCPHFFCGVQLSTGRLLLVVPIPGDVLQRIRDASPCFVPIPNSRSTCSWWSSFAEAPHISTLWHRSDALFKEICMKSVSLSLGIPKWTSNDQVMIDVRAGVQNNQIPSNTDTNTSSKLWINHPWNWVQWTCCYSIEPSLPGIKRKSLYSQDWPAGGHRPHNVNRLCV